VALEADSTNSAQKAFWERFDWDWSRTVIHPQKEKLFPIGLELSLAVLGLFWSIAQAGLFIALVFRRACCPVPPVWTSRRPLLLQERAAVSCTLCVFQSARRKFAVLRCQNQRNRQRFPLYHADWTQEILPGVVIAEGVKKDVGQTMPPIFHLQSSPLHRRGCQVLSRHHCSTQNGCPCKQTIDPLLLV
jgi:hypothetical protein